MINNYQITSGINKNNKEALKELSLYLQNVENTNPFACQQLNEIIENDPKVLFEAQKINNDTKFPMKDLAIISENKKIIGHILYLFYRENTEFGNKTKIVISEEHIYKNIPSNYLDEYVFNRLRGNTELNFTINEKNYQK